jgi:hypothetical protein
MEGVPAEEKIDIDFSADQEQPTLLNTIGNVVEEASKVVEDIGSAAVKGAEAVVEGAETVGDVVMEGAETVGETVQALIPAPVSVEPPKVPVRTRRVKPSVVAANTTVAAATANTKNRPVPKTRKVKKAKNPVASTVEEWVRYKAESPAAYTTTADGLYYSAPLDKDGVRANEGTLQPKAFFRDTMVAIVEKYKARDTGEEAQKIDAEYAAAKVELRRLYNEYVEAKRNPTVTRNIFNASLSGVINANRRVMEAEQVRNKHYGRTCSIEIVDPQPELDKVQFDMFVGYNPATIPKYKYEMSACRINRFPWSYFYTDVQPMQAPVEEPVDQVQMGGGSAEQTHYSEAQKRAIAGKRISLWRAQKGF